MGNGVGAGAPTYGRQTAATRGNHEDRRCADAFGAATPTGLETRRHGGIPNLRGSHSCRAAAPRDDEDHTACHPCRRGRRRSQAASTTSPPATSRTRASALLRPGLQGNLWIRPGPHSGRRDPGRADRYSRGLYAILPPALAQTISAQALQDHCIQCAARGAGHTRWDEPR